MASHSSDDGLCDASLATAVAGFSNPPALNRLLQRQAVLRYPQRPPHCSGSPLQHPTHLKRQPAWANPPTPTQEPARWCRRNPLHLQTVSAKHASGVRSPAPWNMIWGYGGMRADRGLLLLRPSSAPTRGASVDKTRPVSRALVCPRGIDPATPAPPFPPRPPVVRPATAGGGGESVPDEVSECLGPSAVHVRWHGPRPCAFVCACARVYVRRCVVLPIGVRVGTDGCFPFGTP